MPLLDRPEFTPVWSKNSSDVESPNVQDFRSLAVVDRSDCWLDQSGPAAHNQLLAGGIPGPPREVGQKGTLRVVVSHVLGANGKAFGGKALPASLSREFLVSQDHSHGIGRLDHGGPLAAFSM